jgi:type VI secretion system protein ImpL
VPKVLEDVQRLYLNEYIRRWDELLNDLRLLPTDDLQKSIQAMTLLSAGDSPLRQLLQAVARETRLASAPVSSVEQAGAKLVERAASSVREGIEKLLGDTPAASAATETRPEAQVEKHFEQLHRVVLAPAGSQAPLDAVLAVLKEYEVFLRANQEAAARGTAPQPDALIKARIKGEADRLPPPVSGMLNSLVSSSGGQAASAVREGVQKRLAGEVAGLCKPAIEGRYPFARGQATREVPLGDFNNMFRPGGVLDTFAKTNFTGLVDMAGPVWKALKADGVAQIDDASVANFQRAAMIRDAFFPGGAGSPQVQADLILSKADDTTGAVLFKVDEQETRLNPAASGQGVRILWPSLRPAPQLRVVVVNKQGAETASASYEGAWGVFRLMDAMKVEGGTPDRLLVSLNVGTARLQFEMRSASVRNPLRLPELAQFRCPG